MTTTINASTSSGLVVTPDNSGTINLQSNGTTVASTSSAGFYASGNVLQVVYGSYSQSVTTTGTSLITSNVTATITPKFATSKILVTCNMACYNGGNSGAGINFYIYKNGSSLAQINPYANYLGAAYALLSQYTNSYLDSPATTSATTYAIYFARNNGAGNVYINPNNELSSIVLMEIGV